MEGEALKVTNIPKQGLLQQMRVKKYYLRLWLEYIDSLGLTDTPLDKINHIQLEVWLLVAAKTRILGMMANLDLLI